MTLNPEIETDLTLVSETLGDELHMEHAAHDAMARIRAALEAFQQREPASQWVSVGERLPEPGVALLIVYLAANFTANVVHSVYTPDKEHPFSYRYGRLRKVDVTHWMPLPAPPECPKAKAKDGVR